MDNIEYVKKVVDKQNKWRSECINLIASENVMSKKADSVLCSDFKHRYAEGLPYKRYYQGTKYIDDLESKVNEEAKSLFECKQADVRSISGVVANDAVLCKLIDPTKKIMVYQTKAGGHISHNIMGSVGKYTKNIIFFPLTKDKYHIDIERTIALIEKEKPNVLLFGKSLFLFPDPVREIREAFPNITIVYDAAHVLGLIAGKQFQQPLQDGADYMTGSTHKTFFGPQRGIILSNKTSKEWNNIEYGVFPGSTSNHHLYTLPPLLIAFYEIEKFGETYAKQVIQNARILAKALYNKGFDVQAPEFNFTESHTIAVDVSRYGGGSYVAELLEKNNIILNKNLLPIDEDSDPKNPKGIRIGTQEMTRVGMKEEQMEDIAELIKKAVNGMNVKNHVKSFRKKYQKVKYSFDNY